MANRKEFKSISLARLKTAKLLIDAKDWDGASYIMGYVLECGLKAVICKTLNLISYPEFTKKKDVDNYFIPLTYFFGTWAP